MGHVFWMVLLIICSTGRLILGQTIAPTLLQPECSTVCPANKRCVQDNATVTWALSSNDCMSYRACYGSNSDYPDDTKAHYFVGRFYPIVVALRSNLYFDAEYTSQFLKPFKVYNVSQSQFLACQSATHLVGTLTSSVKVPDRFISSVGYKFFIAKARGGFLPCTLGLRLHINVMDVTNCSGTPDGNLCSGKGRCILESFTGDMHCECCSGYTGQYCEEFDACNMDPCQRGNCSDVVAGHSEAFNCTCEAGYTGERCDIDINECDLPENKDVCKNGGFCDDAINAYVCLCRDGFHGDQCEFISNLCDYIKPCKNNANCSRVGVFKESYVCHCAPGFYGRNCTLNTTTSSLVPQLSSIPITSSYQPTSSLVSSVRYSYTSSLNYQVTASSYASVFRSTENLNTTSQFYSSVKTSPFTETMTDLQTSVLTSSSSMIPGSSHEYVSSQTVPSQVVSDSPSLMTNRIASSSVSQLSETTSDISSIYQSTTMNVVDTVSTTRTADATIAPSITSSHSSSANILSSSRYSVDLTLSETMVPTISNPPSSDLDLPSSSTNLLEVSQSSSSVYYLSSLKMSSVVSKATNLQQTSTIDVSPTQSIIATPLLSSSYQFSSPSVKPSVTMATSIVTYPANTPTLSMTQGSTHPSPQISSSLISPSVTMVTPSSSTVVPTLPPLENQTCADGPCGEYGVCRNRDSSTAGLPFHCDCQYPTVGPVCTTGMFEYLIHLFGKPGQQTSLSVLTVLSS